MTIAATQSVVEVIENKIMTDKPEGSSVSNWCSTHWKAILSEFLSTLLLIAFGCMTCIPIEGFSPHPPMYAAFGFGLIVSLNIQTFGHISGAHMNPAMTVASLIWGSTSFALAVAYIIAQCTGAVLGYGILVAVSPIDLVPGGICANIPHAGLTLIQTLGVEVLITAALSFISCACWDPVNEHKQDSVAIKFGLTVAGLSLAAGPLTGAGMNPARSLGPAVWTGAWHAHWVFWAGPLIGGSLAAVLYKYIWRSKKHDS